MPPDLVPLDERDLPVRLTHQDIARAHLYAAAMLTESKETILRARGQSQAAKYQRDCFYSHLAETAVSRALQDLGCSLPTGHVQGKQDWEPDHHFFAGGSKYFLHTKSQPPGSAERFGTAWIIGYGETGQDKRLYDFRPEDYIALVSVPDEQLVYLRAIFPVTHLGDLALITEKGISPRLLHSKRAIRLSQIDNLGVPRFQLPDREI